MHTPVVLPRITPARSIKASQRIHAACLQFRAQYILCHVDALPWSLCIEKIPVMVDFYRTNDQYIMSHQSPHSQLPKFINPIACLEYTGQRIRGAIVNLRHKRLPDRSTDRKSFGWHGEQAIVHGLVSHPCQSVFIGGSFFSCSFAAAAFTSLNIHCPARVQPPIALHDIYRNSILSVT